MLEFGQKTYPQRKFSDNFLEEKNEHNVIVMDETERIQDSRFMVQIEKYFSKIELDVNEGVLLYHLLCLFPPIQP